MTSTVQHSNCIVLGMNYGRTYKQAEQKKSDSFEFSSKKANITNPVLVKTQIQHELC